MEINDILSRFQQNIGKGPGISGKEYGFLMKNISQIPEETLVEIQCAIVEFLLSRKNIETRQPDELTRRGHFGEYFECLIGLHSNPLKVGDLLGLELKIWGKKSQLSLATLSFIKSLKSVTGLTEDEMLCAKLRKGTKCTADICVDPNHTFKMSEGIHYDTPNFHQKLRYFINNQGDLTWLYNKNPKQSPNWVEVSKTSLRDHLQKFDQGLLLGIGNGVRQEQRFTLEELYYIPINFKGIIQLFRKDLVNYEVRYRKEKKNGVWDGVSFHNPGWGFRLRPSWVKQNWLITEYEINTVDEFKKLRKELRLIRRVNPQKTLNKWMDQESS